jgi:hypothetical protein
LLLNNPPPPPPKPVEVLLFVPPNPPNAPVLAVFVVLLLAPPKRLPPVLVAPNPVLAPKVLLLFDPNPPMKELAIYRKEFDAGTALSAVPVPAPKLDVVDAGLLLVAPNRPPELLFCPKPVLVDPNAFEVGVSSILVKYVHSVALPEPVLVLLFAWPNPLNAVVWLLVLLFWPKPPPPNPENDIVISELVARGRAI